MSWSDGWDSEGGGWGLQLISIFFTIIFQLLNNTSVCFDMEVSIPPETPTKELQPSYRSTMSATVWDSGAGGGPHQSSASPCDVPQSSASRLGTCSAFYLWPLSLIFRQYPQHWLFLLYSSKQIMFLKVCQIICKLCFQNWVLFNLILDNTYFHYTKVLVSSPFWFGPDVFVLHVYKGSRRKWKCILGNQVITNWLTRITQC